jgi:imidazolonepropionase-like amidohydrolase
MAMALSTFPEIALAAAKPENNLAPVIDYSKDIILKNCNVLDVINGKTIENSFVIISKGKIRTVGTGAIDDTGLNKIDLQGKYVLPGLIDAHAHITLVPVFRLRPGRIPRLLDVYGSQGQKCIESGVTTIRDMGAFPSALNDLTADITSGKKIGPRIVYCNKFMNIKGGHPDIDPKDLGLLVQALALFMGSESVHFESIDQLKKALEENSQGASFIKLSVDNKSIFLGTKNFGIYTDEHLKTIFDFAEKKGLPVACHNSMKWGFDRMIKYPVRSLEHTITDGFLSDSDLKTLVDKKIAVVPTLTSEEMAMYEEAYDSLAEKNLSDFTLNELKIRRDFLHNDAFNYVDPVIHQDNLNDIKAYKKYGWDHLIENGYYMQNPDIYFSMMNYAPKNIKRMREAGVTIGCGMDAGLPFYYFGALHREYEALSRYGFSNQEILKCATINNAIILGLEDSIGSIEPGKLADITVLKENPLDDVNAYRDVRIVIKEGIIMHTTNN